MQGPKSLDNTDASSLAGATGAPPPPLNQLVHDLNQPLSAINNYAQAAIQLIDSGAADTARLKELFGKIATQCARATTLSQQVGSAAKALAAADSRI